MNRLVCMLTGGHRYADINLTVSDAIMPDYCIIVNHCVKCGKQIKTEINQKAIIAMAIAKEEMKRKKLGGDAE